MMDGQQARRAVVVGVDGSDNATRALRWAVEEAGRRRLPLRVVHAFGWTEEHAADGRPGHSPAYRATLLERAHKLVAAAAAGAHGLDPALEIEQEVTAGSPIAVLAGAARTAQLLVVGDRGLNRLEGLLLGSVAVALATHAACPVVIVRGPEREPTRTATLPVVVGIDGSPTSEAAIAFAFEAAAERKVPLVAVHTWWDRGSDPVLALPMVGSELIEQEAAEVLAERLAGWGEKYPDVAVQRVLVHDFPAPGLLARSTGAQLLVVGTRGHGEFTGLVLGSVSNAAIHRAACPVAVVRPTAQRA
ncbi:universal stress protein [Pseudonocardia sp. GCM10023141]|uniref:universal stress protein n=1 Tax=Pseudonocardia sp. GCM10023141 TaxID=3252653 RepID=UPI0036178C18